MLGIVVPAALRGTVPEWLGLAVTLVVMRVAHRDLVAALAGVATVALCRLVPGWAGDSCSSLRARRDALSVARSDTGSTSHEKTKCGRG
ncbi:MAG TPA: hypothetical protein VMG60_19720 [Burkholderiaceae bacterium]|nr:hypothetical protein [Burkholderiaceae bacterium]